MGTIRIYSFCRHNVPWPFLPMTLNWNYSKNLLSIYNPIEGVPYTGQCNFRTHKNTASNGQQITRLWTQTKRYNNRISMVLFRVYNMFCVHSQFVVQITIWNCLLFVQLIVTINQYYCIVWEGGSNFYPMNFQRSSAMKLRRFCVLSNSPYWQIQCIYSYLWRRAVWLHRQRAQIFIGFRYRKWWFCACQ